MPLWTPSNLGAALKVWWNADDHGTSRMTDDGGGLISSWIDRVGGRAATGTLAQRPVWTSTAVNGRAGLTGDAANTVLNMTNVVGLPAACEIWMLAVDNTSSGGLSMLVRYGDGGKHIGKIISGGVFDTPYVNDGNTSLQADNFTWGDLRPHIIGAYYFGTTEGGRWDGRDFSPLASTAIGAVPNPSTRVALFSNAAGAAAFVWPGAIRQILITSAPLPSAQRQQIEGWLAFDGWNRTDPFWPLPPTHPYYSSAPQVGASPSANLVLHRGKKALWNPLNLGPNVLAAWFNADLHANTTYMTDDGAGLISSHASLNSKMAVTGATTLRPTWASNSWTPSNKAGLTGNGSNRLQFLTPTTLPIGATAGEIWLLVLPTSITGGKSVGGYGGTSGATRREIDFTSSGGHPAVAFFDGATTLTDTINVLSLTDGSIIGGFWNGTSMGGRINGIDIPATTIAPLNTGNTNIRMYSNVGGSSNFVGVLRHKLITTILTPAQRLMMEGYLAADGWNTAAANPLLASHPYKYGAP